MVILLGNANVRESVTILSFIMNGKYYDYSEDWFLDIGEILVMSMAINIFIPIIELLIEMLLTW